MIKKDKLEAIYRLLRTHVEKRGLQDIETISDLENAVEELYRSRSVLLVTGFLVRDCMIGETDGPSGALSLAQVLSQMGKDILLLTDEYSYEMIDAALEILDLDIETRVMPVEGTEKFLDGQISKFDPTHIVAIERPGEAEDGRCYSMNGEDLSMLIPKADHLFKRAKEMGIRTIAIGDGGNELGMGRISSHVKERVKYGETIASCSSSDHMIVAGVSNWGSYGLAAGLSVRAGRNLMHDESVEEKVMSTIRSCGAVDGVTKKSDLSVDGYSFEENMFIYKKIREIASELY